MLRLNHRSFATCSKMLAEVGSCNEAPCTLRSFEVQRAMLYILYRAVLCSSVISIKKMFRQPTSVLSS